MKAGFRRVGRIDYDGLWFAYEISERHLTLKWMRWFPLARVALADIVFVRQMARSELYDLWLHAIIRPFRNWYWPHSWFKSGRHERVAYVIKTRRGSNIHVRLSTGFHYRLRAAIGRVRAP